MRALMTGLNTKHKIDFTLVPFGVILIEFSVFISQLTTNAYSDLEDLVLLRLIHSAGMVLISILVSRSYIRLNRPLLSFRILAITGVLVLAIGDATHAYLGYLLGVDLIGVYRRIGIILLQGCLWFPAFMIVIGKRKEILAQTKAYEERLLVATRARSRNSGEFKELQRVTQDRIRRELHASCSALKEAISKILISNGTITEQNNSIRPLLLGQDLRNISINLEDLKSSKGQQRFQLNGIKPSKILIQQFGILYQSTIKSSPMRPSAYAMVLIALTTPPYIYFYSLQESLVTYPILLVLIFLFSHLITKTQTSGSKIALKMSSALTIVTGLLPYLLHLLVWQIINDRQAYVPTLITALALPLTYYVFMEVLQVFRPQALTLIRNDELRASDSLKESVTNIVSNEFSDNLHHQWAVYIHGKILTRLSATSLKLEAAAVAGDSELYKNTIESLFALLINPAADFNDVSTDLQTEVDNRLAPWVGLLEIDIHIDAQLKDVRTPRVRDLGEVIEELISNSIRHGKAKRIELRIVRSGEKDVEIISIDDASIAPSRPQDNPGLGSRIFNLASDGRWSITRVGSATEFRLMMAIEA